MPGQCGRRLCAIAAAAALAAPATAGELFGALPAGPGHDEVEITCSACHSLAIVKQQRLNRTVWDQLLVWMVEEQGMPELDGDERALILDYLAAHFGPHVPR